MPPTTRDRAISAAASLLGLLVFVAFAGLACEVPWWWLTPGLPFFALGAFLARRGASRWLLVPAMLGLVLELGVSGATLVRDLERYGDAFRADCQDVGPKGEDLASCAGIWRFSSLR